MSRTISHNGVMHVLVGRSEEAGVVSRFLDDPLAEPRALLMEGEPGIGKTTLLRELTELARDRDYAILSCQPSRSEMDLSYVGLVELLGCIATDVINGLPAPQARVLRMVLREQEPDGTFDRLSLRVAVVAVLRAVAAMRPLLIAVDDAQWLDHPTARTVVFAARRLAGTAARVAIVRGEVGLPRLARGVSVWGPAEPPLSDEAVDWRIELARAMPSGRLDVIRLGPVGASELSRIVRRELGWVPGWRQVVRIAELSAGNPLYAVELTRAIGSARPEVGEELGGALPDGVLELARSRIAGLSRHVRAVVELASVPRAAELDLLRRLDPTIPDMRGALSAAAHNGIVAIDGERVRFAHPILAAAAYGSIPVDRRRDLHRAVAALSADPEERARHLAIAAAGPDPLVATAAEEAAEHAWRRGAPDAAADLLGLACKLTPAADTGVLWRRRIAYGRLLHSAGDAPGAVAELESIVASLPPSPLRARALYHLMYVTRLSGAQARAVEYGVQAAAEAASDPSLQAEVYEMFSRLSDGDIGQKLDAARRGMSAIGRVPAPDTYVLFHVRAALVEAEFYAGLGVHLELLDGMDPSGARAPFPPARTAVRGEDLIGRLLAYDGRVDDGLAALRALHERASVAGRSSVPAVLGWMAEAQLISGQFTAAAELTRQAIESAEDTGGTPWEVGFHAVALAMLGQLDEAETCAWGVLKRAEADPAIGLDEWPARLALGVAALARSRAGDAVTHLRHLDLAKQRAGIREPRLCAHAADFIEALVGTGELTEAHAVLARFEEEAVTTGGQWSLAAAARCRALVLAAEGRLDDAVATAEHSLSLFEGLPMPFERGRTVLVIGQLRRRRKEKRLAREALAEALAIFEGLQAPVWAGRARAELARIPQRRTGDGGDGTVTASALTATEESIAQLAAEGLTNREIADRLFVSPKTVEVNLTRIYRKLGVRSRAALAAGFATARNIANRRETPDSLKSTRL